MAGRLNWPSNNPLVDANGLPTQAFILWFEQVNQTISAERESGITADRPTVGLWLGRPYFDTTLNIKIFLKTANPNVWVNGIGTTV